MSPTSYFHHIRTRALGAPRPNTIGDKWGVGSVGTKPGFVANCGRGRIDVFELFCVDNTGNFRQLFHLSRSRALVTTHDHLLKAFPFIWPIIALSEWRISLTVK